MSHEIYFDNIRYISAKEAGVFANVTSDYIGRLARSGAIKGKRVGKNWYVEESSLRFYLAGKEQLLERRRTELKHDRRREYQKSARSLEKKNKQVAPATELKHAGVDELPKMKSMRTAVAHVASQKNFASPHMRVSPLYVAHPAFDFAHKLTAIITGFVLVFGTYAYVHPESMKHAYESTRSGVTSILYNESEADSQVAAVSASGVVTGVAEFFRNIFGIQRGVVSVTVAAYRALPMTPTATTHAPQPTTVINQPVIERVRETIRTASGISEMQLEARLARLITELTGSLRLFSNTSYRQDVIVSDSFGDALGGTLEDLTIINSSWTGGTITNATITGGSISTNTLSGVVATANGGTGTSSAPTYGQVLLGNTFGGYDLVATSSLGITGGSGTFLGLSDTPNALAVGDLLFANAVDTLATLPLGINGQVLKVVGGLPQWAADLQGSGGAGVWATSTDDLLISPSDPTDVVIIGSSATSTTGNILEVAGNALFRGLLTAYNTITAPRFVATSSVASVFPYASTTMITATSASTTNLVISGLPNALLATNAQGVVIATTTIGANLLDTSGNWSGTFDGQEGSFYLTNSFSTTSASHFSALGLAFSTTSNDYWKSVNNFFSTSSAQYFASVTDLFSTTSANYFVHSSTTIPKAYTANIFTSGQTFNGGVTIGSQTGPLQAVNGVVSATGTLSLIFGGTGTSTAPTYGQVLLGNSFGGYDLVATSSLGIVSGGSGASAFGQTFELVAGGTALAPTTTVGLLVSASSTFTGISASTATITNATSTNFFATNARFTNATTTNFGINNETFTDLTGAGLTNSGGILTLDTSGNWTGTFDGQEGSFYLSNGFSTTSASHFSALGLAFSTTSTDFWKSVNNFFSTTSAQYFASVTDLFSTTSANYFVHSSTTIPKTYTENSFSALQTFGSGLLSTASSTIGNGTQGGGLTISGGATTTGYLSVLSTATSTFAGGVSALRLDTTSTSTLAGVRLTNILGCTEALETDSAGNIVCGTDSTATGAADAFNFATNYGAIVAATTSPIWAQNGIFASSTSHFVNADFVNATTSALGITGVPSALLSTNAQGTVVATTSLASSYLTGIDKGFFFSTTSASHFSSLGLAFSTTSNDYWKSVNNFFSTTSAQYFASVTDLFSTTSANYFVHSSTTIPKSYSTNLFTGANTFNGAFTLGSLNGPLQANNGLVSATTSIGVLYGGTGLTSAPTFGQILVGQTNGSYALTATSSLGLPTFADLSQFSTFAYPFPNNATTTLLTFANGLIAQASSTIVNLTSLNSTTTNATTTSFGINNETFTDLTGTGLTNSGGVLTLDTTGNWSGTFDGQEGSFYLANSFSTTSASHFSSLGLAFSTTSNDYWMTQRNFFSTTSAQYFASVTDLFSTTSANYFVHSSTTIPKTYTTNTFTGANTFNALVTVSNLLVTGSTTLQNFTAQNSTTTNATTTNLAITGVANALLATDANGRVYATTTISSNLLDTTGNWSGTFDGQEGSFYLANSFSTTSADNWKNNRNFFSTTSADYYTSVTNFFSTTSAIHFVHSSTTIPKTYTANTFTGAQSFTGGLTSNVLTLGTLNGPLQANNGLVSATTSIGVLYGGTGLTSAPTLGQILVGNSSGGYTLTATSSLGLPTFAYLFPNNATTTLLTFNGGFTSFASTTIGNGTQAGGLTISGGATTTGNLFVAGTLSLGTALDEVFGGTGQTSYTTGDLLYASGPNTLAKLPVGVAGQVLKVTGGLPAWGADITSGGGGGATAWSTTTDSLAIYPTDTSHVLIIGNSATTTANSILEIFGTSYFSSNVGIGTTSAGSLLSIGGVANFAPTGSTLYSSLALGTLTATSSLIVTGNTTLANATTTNLGISSITNSLLKTNGDGTVVAAIAGTDYVTAANLFAYPFPNNATSTLLNFSGGLTAFASTTIGNGTQAGGLTISGGATTTGNAYFAGNIGIGTPRPEAQLDINGGSDAALAYITTDTDIGSSPIASLWFGVDRDGTPNWAGIGQEEDGSLRFTGSGDNLSVPDMVITDSGFVGIGTTTPSTLLSIAGSTGLFASTTATSTFQGGGINLITAAGNTGCFAINGVCVGSSSASTTLLSDHNTFTGNNMFLASTTIGNGTATGGLTISGSATTTGDAYFGAAIVVGGTLPTIRTTTNRFSVNETGAFPPNETGMVTQFSSGEYGRSIFAVTHTNTNTAFFGLDDHLFTIGGEGDTDIRFSRNLSYSSSNILDSGTELLRIQSSTGNIGIGTTSPYAKLSVVGEAVAANFTATTTAVNTFPTLLSTNATTTNLGLTGVPSALLATRADGSVYATTSISSLLLDTTGNWTGTFDGQEGTFYLDRANHTGTQLAATISDFNSAVNSFVAGSTTIPKTYTSNTFTGAQTLNGGLTVGTLNGPLQANNGVVSATTSIGVLYGGTGLTSAPSLGQLLVGNSSGGYTLTATSSLGLPTSADLANYLALVDWYATTTDGLDEGNDNLYFTQERATDNFIANLAATTSVASITSLPNLGTVSTALTGVLKATAGVLSAAAVNLATEVAGILGVPNGGTGWGNIQSGTVLLGNGTGALATTTRGNLTETGSSILTITGGTNAVLGSGASIQVAQASGSQSGFLSSSDWNLFNNKVSSSSLDSYFIDNRDWQVVAGALAPTTTRGILVSASSTIGNGTQGGGLTISGGATTTGNALFSSGVLVLGSTTLQNFTAVNSTTTNATTTRLALTGTTNALLATDANGRVYSTTTIGYNLLDTSGNWTGTFDGQEGSFYLANSFSTTSANNWSSLGLGFSTTSAINFAHSSTTIPKMYSTNVFTGANTFNGGLTISTLNGPLHANNGVVSATTSIGVLYGGTGLTSAPSLGNLLVGNSSGGYTLTATSSLGLIALNQRDWSVQGNGYLAPTTTRGIFVNASSTIGNGTQAGGLTISGGATTTGNAYFAENVLVDETLRVSGNVGIGEANPQAKLHIHDETDSGLLIGRTDDPSIRAFFRYNGAANVELGTTGTDDIHFLSNSITQMTIGNGVVGIGTTSPYAKLSVVGNVVAANFTATTTAVNTFPTLLSTNATTTSFGINNETFTDLTGTGLTNSGGVLTLDTTGNWSGTFDGQEGSFYLANSFSTTSASHFLSLNQGNAFSTTSAINFVHSSTTIPKLYSSNTWTGANIFNNLVTVSNLLATSSTTLQNFTFVNATGTAATTTNLAVSSIASGSLVKTTTGGALIAAVAGTDYSNFAFPWTPTALGNSTSTLLIMTNGLMATASSTIGDGTQTGGLTISGGATTTQRFDIFAANGNTNATLFQISSSTSAFATTTLFSVNNTGATTIRSTTNAGSANPQLRVTDGTVNFNMFVQSGNAFIGPSSNHGLVFQTANSNRGTIDLSGRWGVNTTAPTYQLEVNGNARVVSFVDAANFIATSSSATSLFNGNFLVMGSSTLQNFTFLNATGTAATTTALAVSGIASGSLVKTTTGGALVAAVAGTDYQTFGYPFPSNATTTLLAFNGGLTTTNATATNLFGATLSANTARFGQTATTSIDAAGNTVIGGTFTVIGGLSTLSNLLVTGSTTLQNLTAVNATTTNATTTSFGINNETFTDLTGTGLTNSGGVLTLDTTGNWSGTFDGQEGSFYLANSFSTTSASHFSSLGLAFSTTSNDYWMTQRNFFSTTSASHFLSLNQGNAFSTTSAINFVHSSTTIPKTYTNNTFAGTNTFDALVTVSNLLTTGSTTLQNFTFTNATGTAATTTSLAISSISNGSLLKTTTGGALVAAVAGTDYQNFAYPFQGTGNSTSTLTQFSGGLTGYASSTIGAGGQNTGLTVSGGATTTGFLKVLSTATSSFAGGLEAAALNVTSSTASSTFANGINLSGGCFAINNTCVGTGGASLTGTQGQLAYFSGVNTAVGTSSLFLDTNGNFGIGTTSPYAKLSVVGEVAARNFTATSTTATSTFAGGVNIGNGALTHDFSSGLTAIENLAIGAMEFDADSGVISWVDMPVTSDSTSGTVNSYSAQIDGTPILTVFSQADGSGGITASTARVGVGTTSPYAKLGVEATSAQTNPVFEVAASGGATKYLSTASTGFGTTTLSGLTIAGSATTTSNVGIRLSAGCFAMPDGTCATTNVGTVTGTGSAGRVGYWSSASALTSSASFTFDGTTLASTEIQAAGANPFLYVNDTDTATADFRIGAADGQAQIEVDVNNSAANSYLSFGLDGRERARFATNNAFLVGTTTGYASTTIWGNTNGRIFEVANNASTSALWVSGAGFSTTTVSGLNISGSATSTSNVGINLSGGCFAINTICVTGGGSGTPGGLTTQVQFNEAGAFAGNAGFTFDSSLAKLTVTNASTSKLSITGGHLDFSAMAATTTIVNNSPYAWTIATSTTGHPLFRIDTTGGVGVVTIGAPGGDVYIGDVGSGSDLVFEESSTIHGQGTNTLTFGTAGDKINFAVNTGFGSTTPGTLLSLGDTGNNTINLSATATSTFGSGINLRTGCFSVGDVCIGGSTGSSFDYPFPSNATTTLLAFNGGLAATNATSTNLFSGNFYANTTRIGQTATSTFSSTGQLTLSSALLIASNDAGALGASGTAFSDLFLASGSVINLSAGDVTMTHGTNVLTFAGATTNGYQFADGPIRPVLNDGVSLGISGTAFSDLFLASGSVINLSAGDVTMTHGTNVLTFAGATTNGYQFADGPIRPVLNDGVSLGISGTAFSDLFLASGSVINLSAGDVTMTHGTNVLTFAGASSGYVFSDGNVGIGTTSPYRRLSVTDTVSTAQQAIAYDQTRFTELLTDASGDFTINPSGNDVLLTDENLWVCTSGCPAAAPAGTGNLIVETRLGVGTSTPDTKLSIETQDSSTDFFRVASTTNQSLLIVNAAGRVGIGTSTPTQQLSIANLLYVGAGGTTGMGTATSTFQGDVKITGKLDVSTIDPPYTVDGVKYATYVASMIGVKEELVRTINLDTYNARTGKYETVIAFDELETGSDLWLFYQITKFGADWKDLVVQLTPAFDGTVFYSKDVGQNALVISGSEGGEVSLRLTAARYDADKWPNLRPDQDGNTEGTHVISSKPKGGEVAGASTSGAVATSAVSFISDMATSTMQFATTTIRTLLALLDNLR